MNSAVIYWSLKCNDIIINILTFMMDFINFLKHVMQYKFTNETWSVMIGSNNQMSCLPILYATERMKHSLT